MATNNKNYIIQSAGDTNWGLNLNTQMIEYVDLNLGGVKNQTLSNTNVTFSLSDSRNVIYRLTGTLTANVTVYVDATVSTGFLIVENLTTGNFTVSVGNTTPLTATATVTQNTRAFLISDNTNGVRIAAQTYTNLVNTFSAGSTGLTPSTGTSGDITLAGTLNVANGGTGSASLTANNVLLGNGTSALQVVAPGTAGNFLTSNGTTWASQTFTQINYGTLTASTSGSVVNFNNVIPSTAKRINVLFNKVSFTGSDELIIQLGTGTGPTYVTTGYESSCALVNGTGTGNSTGGFQISVSSTGSNLYSGCAQLFRLSTSNNAWFSTSLLSSSLGGVRAGSSSPYFLSEALTSIRIIPSGTNTFDAGSINIVWES